jgi:hypothetical protein
MAARTRERLLVALFLTCLMLPLITMQWPKVFGPTHGTDWWRPGMPTSWEGRFEHFFGLRKSLTRLWGRVELGVLHSSSSSSVMLGKNGWLYLSDQDSLDSMCHTHPFSEADLAAICGEYARRELICRTRGIDYRVLIAPDKSTIYPENLPSGITPAPHPSRFDQLMAYAREHHPELHFIDVRDAIRAHKSDGYDLYMPTDSHWNEVGGFFAMQAALAQMPGARVPQLTDFHVAPAPAAYDVLVNMLGLDGVIEQPYLAITSTQPTAFREQKSDESFRFETFENPEGELGRVVVLHDSMFMCLRSHFGRHFKGGAMRFQYDFPQPVLEQQKPKFVLQECAEYRLAWVLPEYASGDDHI